MSAQVQNPNWPRITDVVDFYDSRGTPIAGCLTWVDLTQRGRGTMGITVGRNYETDAQRAGELKTTLDNYDAALDPTNTASPFAPLVLLRRPIRRLAQYPVTTNLLTPDQATAGSYSAAADGTMMQVTADTTRPGAGTSLSDTSGFLYVSSDTNSAGVRLTTVTDGPNSQCPNCYQVPMTAGQTGNAVNIWVPVVPGRQYTLQWRARCITSGQSPQVAARVRFVGSGGPGNTVSSATGTAATLTGHSGTWSTVTVTVTAPTSGVFGMAITLAVTTGASGACTIQATAAQLEKGSSASAWGLPGQVYSLITAYVERWPQDYADDGSYPVSAITASDYLALLNQGQLLDAIGATISAYQPTFYFRLDDPQGSTEVVDAAGVRRNAPVVSPATAGTLTFGNRITAATPSLVPQGTTGTVATFGNTATAFTGIDLTCGGTYPAGPGGGALTQWSRMITFRCSTATANEQMLWASHDSSGIAGRIFEIGINSSGYLFASATIDAGAVQVAYTGSTSICDGNWHTVLVAVNVNGTCAIYLDDVQVATATGGGATMGALTSDFVGAELYAGGPLAGYSNGFTGDIAHVAEVPVCVTPFDGWGLYAALVTAYSADGTTARWKRLLEMANPFATYRASTGATLSVAPATDIAGRAPFAAMDQMVVTENGDQFSSGWGITTFRSRTDRYDTSPLVVFGERSDLGELPYENPTGFDYDDTRIFSQAQVTQQPSGNLFTATDTRYPLPYGPATLTRDSYASSRDELRDSATYLLQRYMDPHLRLRSIVLHPGANPALWQACLSLSVGSRVRVMRRPQGLNPITWDGFVEKIAWSFSPADAKVVLQLSPADTQTYWILAGGPTATLQATASAGSVSISASGQPGATMLNAGYYLGQPLILDPGQPSSERVTVTGAPVVTTAVSGGAVVFTATVPVTATVNTHNNGAAVSPAGAVPGGLGSLAAFSVLDYTTRLGY